MAVAKLQRLTHYPANVLNDIMEATHSVQPFNRTVIDFVFENLSHSLDDLLLGDIDLVFSRDGKVNRMKQGNSDFSLLD